VLAPDQIKHSARPLNNAEPDIGDPAARVGFVREPVIADRNLAAVGLNVRF